MTLMALFVSIGSFQRWVEKESFTHLTGSVLQRTLPSRISNYSEVRPERALEFRQGGTVRLRVFR